MAQRSFHISTFLLITAIVLHLALPLSTGVVCTLPDTERSAAFFGLSTSAQNVLLPSLSANDHTEPIAFPELQPQTGAHSIATHTVWDPLPVSISLPFFVLRFPSVASADRLFPNTGIVRVWRPPIPFPSSL